MEITRGKLAAPQRVVIYGPEGIGKTSLAARFPGAVFIDTEGSTRNFDVARYPDPNSWEGLLQTVRYAMEYPQNQQTLVIDTADWAEKLCVQAVCDRAQKTGIEDFGYGKGYVYLKEEFAKLLTYLDGVIAAGIHVVVTAHAALRKVEQPDEMGSYDHWELKLTKFVGPMLKEWADLVLFCNYKTIVVQDENKKNKAQGGRRVMYTAHHPCWDAKNRHNLPPELPMEWEAIAPAILGTQPEPVGAHSVPPQVTAPPVGAVHERPAETRRMPERANRDSPLQQAASVQPPSSDLPPALTQLMAQNQVTEKEIQIAVGGAGYFPSDMPVRDYPPDFISGVLVACWPQVFAKIQQDRDELPF